VGPFTLDAAVGLDEIATSTPEALWARVLPADAAIAAWPVLQLDDGAARAFVHGQSVPASAAPGAGALRRVHDRAGRLLGVGEIVAGGHQMRPLRILHVDRPGTPVLP
jgi:tRNA U55 pseudouridine synthase TruB